MADKKLYEDDLDFRDDLDLNLDDYENNDLLDEGSTVYEESYSKRTTSAAANPQPQGFGDFIKSYGIIVIPLMIVAFFGLRYFYNSGSAVESNETPKVTETAAPMPLNMDANSNPDSTNTSNNPPLDANGVPMQPTDQAANAAIIPGMPITQPTNTAEVPVTTSNTMTETIPLPSTPNGSLSADLAKQPGDLDSKIAAIGQSIDTINKMIAEQKNTALTVEDLKKQVADMSSRVGSQTDVTALKNQIQTFITQQEQLLLYVQGVGTAVGQLSEQVKKQQVIVSSFVSSNIGTPVGKNSGQDGLVVEAVISDRAWLKTISGQAFSVTTGDKIPGYGKVLAIDAIKGEISTDSGLVLTQ